MFFGMKKADSKYALHFTTNHTGKMQGMISISTSCKANERCAKNAQIKGSVCERCYAQRMHRIYGEAFANAFLRNTEVLTTEIIPFEELPIINAAYFRIESFGDLMNEVQAINYLNLIRKNPQTFFGWWTKNPDILAKAIRKVGKPDNVGIIRSSLFLNKEARKGYDFVDAVFTVYTADYIRENNIEINCGARNCLTCGKCYRKGGAESIREKLK